MKLKYFLGLFLIISILTIVLPNSAKAATLLSDDFTGTTINTAKWTEVDTGGAGGSSGNIQQNGTLTVANSFSGTWGQNSLNSLDTFSSTSLEVSAVMTRGSDQLLGYGDHNFQTAGTKAFILDLVGGVVYSIAWENNVTTGIDTSCGTYTAGATYKIKVISGGFEAYKNGVLMCTQLTSTVITNKPIFLQSSAGASTFDDVLVTGNAVSAAPDAPSSLVATAGNTQVALSWTAPNANGSAITDYIVEYKLTSEPTTWTTFADGTSTSTSATVTGLTNSSAYDFRVKAVNGIGTSIASSTVSATPSAPTVPVAPTIGSALAGNASASVSFTSGSNGGSAITGYTVTSSPGGFTGTGASSPITVSGLTNGTPYTFTVIATNAIGNSYSSSASNSVTPSIEVPTTIGTIALWLDGSDASSITESGGLITQVNDKSGNNKNSTASGTTRPTLSSGALNGRSVMNFDGSTDYLNINSSVAYRTVAVVAKYTPGTTFADYNGIIGDFSGASPGAGHVLNGNSGTNKLATGTASFSSAYRNGTLVAGSSGHDFSPINEYWIGVFTLPASQTNTTSAIGKVNGGGRYWSGDIAEVIAYSSTLTTNERQSLENYLSTKWGIAVVGPAVPGAPTALGATRGNTQVGLSWTAPASDGGTSITDYIVEYKLTSEPTTWTIFSDGTSAGTTATVTGLTNGLSYDFRVRAVNFIGNSIASNTATRTPGPAIAPDAPTGVTAVEGNTQATITFTAPVDNGGASITSYTVTSSPGSFTSSGASSPRTVTGLTNGVSYTFTVTATNSAGTSVASSSSNSIIPSTLGNQLTDNFTGTTINTTKWYELDPTGVGGTTGKVLQNGSLAIADSYNGSVWGNTALISQDVFDSTSLEISASMTPGSSPLIGYGDHDFAVAGKKAYLLYVQNPSSILALSWDGVISTQTSCGAASASAATYKMKIVSGGFEVYKDGVLMCTHTNSVFINNARVFLESSATASTFDDMVVYGLAVTHAVPGAPTIGTATAGNASASVTFTPPNYNNGAAITGYTVTSSPGGITGTGSSSPITVSGLTNNTAYTFTVTATNSVGSSSASSASNSDTPTLPPAPGQVTGLVATGVNKQVLLGWYAPSSGGTPTDYLVEYKLSSSGTWLTFADGTSITLKAVVTGLTNASSYDFRVSGVNNGNPGTASTVVTATPNAIANLSFVITGESNSGGIGSNASATAGELASRSAVQIMNLTSGNFLFENLDIGTNNLRDHAGLEGYYNTSHGLELQLANSTEANDFPDNPQVYLVKTGQGGSQVSQWNYAGTNFTKFLQRTTAAKTQIPSNRKWVVWMSIGINDGIAGTNINTFKTNLTTYINNIKADLPGAIIVMTQFQSMPASLGYPTINTALADVAAAEPNVYVVDTTAATGTDGANHWLYSGLKTVASSMVTTTKNTLGLNYPGLVTNLAATPSSASVGLTWTAPISNGGSSITDYLIEYKLSASSTWTTFADGTSTTVSTTVTGLSGITDYDFRISAVNSNGSGNSVSVSTTTTDGAAPSISSISSTPSTTSTSITWTTDELSSSQVDYGLTDGYGSSTTEKDTSPRVTIHTESITSLVSCTTYHYRVRSKDQADNEGIGTDNTFTTTGCTGGSDVVDESSTSITTSIGGTTSLTPGTTGISLDIPSGATGTDAVYQIKALNKNTVLNTTGTPTDQTAAGNYVFDLKSLTNTNTLVSTFSSPITITLSYQNSDIEGLDESSLSIYRYDGTWNLLDNCLVDTSLNTVTCETSNFSVFGLFGTLLLPSSSSSNRTSSGTSVQARYQNLLAMGNIEAAKKLKNEFPTLVTPTNPTIPTISLYTFIKTLKQNLTDPEVKELQKYLNNHGYTLAQSGPGSIGKETNYFGSLTKEAVIRFQLANKLLGDGIVGPMTRSKLINN